MNFLLDANMPRSSAALLRSLGHDLEDVRDVLPNGAEDSRVAAHAQKTAHALDPVISISPASETIHRRITPAWWCWNCPTMWWLLRSTAPSSPLFGIQSS